MAKNSRENLGKGLKALLGSIGENEDKPEEKQKIVKELSGSIIEIPLDEILVNKYQPRESFDDQLLMELAESIKTYGLIQPITVRRVTDHSFELISGERRFRASKLAKLKTIPAYVRLANDNEMLEMALVENIQREDLNAIEIAQSFDRMLSELELSHDEISQRVGKKRSTVTNFLRLLKLPPSIKSALRSDKISMGHARAILGLDEVEDQLYAFDRIRDGKLSVRAAEELIKKLKNPKKSKSAAIVKDKNVEKVEAELSRTLGAQVSLNISSKGEGFIKIPFKDKSTLNNLLDLFKTL